MSRLILVARVAGGFGVVGEVRIIPFGDDPAALLTYRALYRKDGAPALTLTDGRVHKGALIARAAEIKTKEAADALRGLDLYAPREAFPAPEEDEFYLADLIGLEVAHLDGRALGRITAVPNYGAGDLLEIQPPEGHTYLIPFTRAAVPTVDIAAGVVTVDPPTEID